MVVRPCELTLACPSPSQVASRRERVKRILAKLGIRAHIVAAHLKPSTTWDWAAVRRSKAFVPETLETLTAGEVAVSLSQRKALNRCVHANNPPSFSEGHYFSPLGIVSSSRKIWESSNQEILFRTVAA